MPEKPLALHNNSVIIVKCATKIFLLKNEHRREDNEKSFFLIFSIPFMCSTLQHISTIKITHDIILGHIELN